MLSKILGISVFTFLLFSFNHNPKNAIFLLELPSIVSLLFIIGLLFYNPHILYGKHFFSETVTHQLVNEKKNEAIINELKSKDYKLRSAIISDTETNIFVDSNYKILHFNQLADKRIKDSFNKQIQIGEDFRTYLHARRENEFAISFSKAISGERCGYEAEVSFNGFGPKAWHQLEFIPIYNDESVLIGVSMITTNIEKKKKAQIKNEQYSKALEDIAWRDSHLLRAPISNLLGITGLLNESAITVSEDSRKQLLLHIETEVQKLDQVIRSIIQRTQDSKL